MVRLSVIKYGLAALLSWVIVTPAATAHPHMFFASTAQFILDTEGRLQKLKTVFLVDELNTLYTFTELGVNTDGDQKLSPQEKRKIAETVLEGFGYYDYFLKLRDQNGPITFGKPEDVSVHLVKGRLGLSFVMPLETPLALPGKIVSLQLYDPTYFTAISIDRKPMVVGQHNGCTVAVRKPSETEEIRQSQQLLSQLSREETPEEEDVGVLFAETTTLQC